MVIQLRVNGEHHWNGWLTLNGSTFREERVQEGVEYDLKKQPFEIDLSMKLMNLVDGDRSCVVVDNEGYPFRPIKTSRFRGKKFRGHGLMVLKLGVSVEVLGKDFVRITKRRLETEDTKAYKKFKISKLLIFSGQIIDGKLPEKFSHFQRAVEAAQKQRNIPGYQIYEDVELFGEIEEESAEKSCTESDPHKELTE